MQPARSFGLLAVLLAAVALPVSGQTATSTRAADQSSSSRVVVQCADTHGQPVSDAEVYVFQGTKVADGSTRYRGTGPFETGEDGYVRGPAAVTFDDGNFDRWVYARVPGRLVGGARSFRHDPQASHESAHISVVLYPSRSLEGVVTTPDGFDTRHIRIKVLSMQVYDEARLTGGSATVSYLPRFHGLAGLDVALPTIFESAVDSAGRFTLNDVPQSARIYLASEGVGLGQAQYANIGAPPAPIVEPVAIEMRPENVLAGRVQTPSGRPIEGLSVKARVRSERGVYVRTTFDATTNAEGRFRIAGLPDIGIDLYVRSSGAEWVFRPRRVQVSGGEETEDLIIQAEPGTLVGGTVVDAVTRQPIEGVTLIAITDDQPSASLGHAATDGDGRFSLRLPAGTARLYFGSKPIGYDYPAGQIVCTLNLVDDKSPIDNLSLVLEPTKATSQPKKK